MELLELFGLCVEICNLMHLRGNKQTACDLGFETVNVSNGIVSC